MARETTTGGREATTGVIPGAYALSVGKPDKPLPDGWGWRQLTSLARLESGHTPSRRHPEYWDGDIPWVGIRDATSNYGRTIYDTQQHTNQLGIDNSSARVLPEGTVCLSRTASVGYVIVMGRPMATSQDFVNWICTDQLNNHFLKYVLIVERESLNMFSMGTTHQTIYYPEVKAFHVATPPRPEQDAIAALLGSLDDKIELNRRMNETLEAMARAIFKDWFVDFGPTRAKAEGRDPYLAPEIWNLFPDALDDTAGLPEGWQFSKIEDYLELAYGKSLPAKTRRLGGVTVYGSGGLTGFHDEALIYGPAVIVGRKGTVGSLYWEDRPVFPIDTVFYVVPKRSTLLFCYQLLLAQPLADMNTDAAVPGLNRGNAYRLEFPWPGSGLTDAFEALAAPLWKQRSENLRESETLAAIRDLLLPKLMSGEIRLREAEKAVEAVA